jgi:hypothetical protein
MNQLPELQEGTPAAQPEVTPVRKRKVISPMHDQPALPRALGSQRRNLADGWTWRLVCGQGLRTVAVPVGEVPLQLFPACLWVPEPDRSRKTEDVLVEVGSISLRCAHPDGRRAVAVWVWRADTQAWAFSGPAYAWLKGVPTSHYECDASEWRDLVRWVPELEVAA